MFLIRNFNPEEIEAFQQFTKNVKDLKQDDVFVARFLKAKDFNLAEGEKQLRETVAWRKEIGMDNCKEWKFPKTFPSLLPYTFSGRDYEGAPICWFFAGRWDSPGLAANGLEEKTHLWGYRMIEEGRILMDECDSPCQIIVDLEGLSYTHITNVPTMRGLHRGAVIFDRCFPEIVKTIIIINAPWIFTAMFNVIKATISQRTMSKIKVFGSNKTEWSKEIMAIIPPEIIPPRLTYKM